MDIFRKARTIVAVSLLAAGCGGTSGITTGLPRDKQMSSLTSADLRTACVNTRKSETVSDSEIRGICAAFAISEGEAACNASLDACVAMEKQAADPAACDTLVFSTSPFSACTATVGDYEDCLNAAAAEAEHLYGSLNCASPAPMATPFDAPGCSTFNAKCPVYVTNTTHNDMGT